MTSWGSEHLRHLRSSPSPDGLVEMTRAIGKGLRVGRVRRLGGGLGCATSAVDLMNRSGTTRAVVLKRFPTGDNSAGLEWERLMFAQGVDVPSPEPVALDESGKWFGTPALVMSKMSGAPSLRPARPEVWMREVAATFATVQSFDVSRARGATPGWVRIENRVATT